MTSILKKSKKLKLVPDINIEEKQEKLVKQVDQDDEEKQEILIKHTNKGYISDTNKYDYLYPSLDDPNFNIKITKKKEFFDTKYDGKIYNVESQANVLCNAKFELAPHQLFVRNFLSFLTPYNSLLLYHGLGSGKTCSAIGIAEEMRDYLKQMGITQRIIVVASPNVQENFKLQLFDERKLTLVDGLWDIRTCTGNKFIKEINPMNMKGLTKENVSRQIKRIINSAYLFLGYIEFANYISKKSKIGPNDNAARMKKKLKKVFNNRLIIIDEVHNIRSTEENDNKRVAHELLKLVKNVDNLRLLLLSATPMFNTYKEIVWLINLMNINDNRPPINIKDIFDSQGNFKENENGDSIGKELLQRKATGYVSFVRGENPYTFPYRIWPSEFDSSKTFNTGTNRYPTLQMNNRPIVQGLEFVSVYLTQIGEYQQLAYDYIIQNIKNDIDSKDLEKQGKQFEDRESFGYTTLQRPLEALNIVYPNSDFKKDNVNIKYLVGKNGLKKIMNFKESVNPPMRSKFSYKGDERIFSQENISKYSGKISSICSTIINSEGIILIYSQYIDGGLVPVALALEEMGFTRYGNTPSLFAEPPVDPLNLNTWNLKQESDEQFTAAKYAMITGDKALSPNNNSDLKALTNLNNKDGSSVKVVLISQAGSEGLDFKYIRQVHIMEPWYNMNRIEQIIGRTCRHCSHAALEFSKRNVQIYLHGTTLYDEQREAADLYVYRLAEIKAVRIGRVSRLLKKMSVDCLLNHEQSLFTVENMNQTVNQTLSSNQTIEYAVGDKPFTAICDYMKSCDYTCSPNANITAEDVVMDTYSEPYILINTDKIIQRIKQLMKEQFFYRKQDLIARINAVKTYPLVQINSALMQLVDDNNEYIVDKYDRLGNLINIGDLYLFQPLELDNLNETILNRSSPIDYKHNKIIFKLPVEEKRAVGDINEHNYNEIASKLLASMEENYLKAFSNEWKLNSEEDWYKYAGVILNSDIFSTLNKEDIDTIIFNHMLDNEIFVNIFYLLNFFSKNTTFTEFQIKLKEHLEAKIIYNSSKNIAGFFWPNNGLQNLLVKQGDLWKQAENEDYEDLKTQFYRYIIPKNNMNDLVGYYSNAAIRDSKNYSMVFKLQNITDLQARGNRCKHINKKENEKRIRALLPPDTPIISGTQPYLCVLLEIILRVYDLKQQENKRWFLEPIEYIMTLKK